MKSFRCIHCLLCEQISNIVVLIACTEQVNTGLVRYKNINPNINIGRHYSANFVPFMNIICQCYIADFKQVRDDLPILLKI